MLVAENEIFDTADNSPLISEPNHFYHKLAAGLIVKLHCNHCILWGPKGWLPSVEAWLSLWERRAWSTRRLAGMAAWELTTQASSHLALPGDCWKLGQDAPQDHRHGPEASGSVRKAASYLGTCWPVMARACHFGEDRIGFNKYRSHPIKNHTSYIRC